MLRKKKRGSLALSMNAIVVLIMAIAMLGVGLGVIQMVRQKAESSLEEIAAEEAPAPAASSSNPITISRTTIPARPGEEFVVKIKYYNGDADKCTATASATTTGRCAPYVNCGSATVLTTTIAGGTITDIETSNKTIAQYESKEFIVKMKIDPSADPGFHICSLNISNGGPEEKDIVIKVI